MARFIPIEKSPRRPSTVAREFLTLLGFLAAAIAIALVLVRLAEPLAAYDRALGALIAAAAALAALYLTKRRRAAPAAPGSIALSPLHMIALDEVPAQVREVMDVRLAVARPHAAVFRGPLAAAPADAYAAVARLFPEHTVMLDADPEVGARFAVLPMHAAQPRPARPLLALTLLTLTFLTTTLAGALYAGIDLQAHPQALWAGLPYSAGLLAILGVHELGHYLTARRRGMNVSLPYFIPAPLALGTFGAFIRMREPARTRGALFDMAAAGPLAGLAMALPILWLGLRSSALTSSHLTNGALGQPGVNSSLLFGAIARLAIDAPLPPDAVVVLSPLAFAGWLGLLVTALNLIPIGELDGGHIVHAMFGRAIGDAIGSAALIALFALALFAVPGLLLWAFVVFIIAGRTVPPRDDLTPLSPRRQALGWLTLLIFASIIAPYPAGLGL